jgi:uncharacterized coiled-coil DUF342 family protein
MRTAQELDKEIIANKAKQEEAHRAYDEAIEVRDAMNAYVQTLYQRTSDLAAEENALLKERVKLK